MPNSKEKRWKDCSRIADGKRIFKRIYGKEFDDLYQEFNFATHIDEFIEKEQINVHVFTQRLQCASHKQWVKRTYFICLRCLGINWISLL
ncbi:MAG: hypothetical protein EZS28_038257 [Streblomastix strix]|uniref:Uncharacterized protein n=1 Tax=Streblomastix strix TaxID=222440 RepID=A0A5J4U5S8_9EUKA|nr:MAG: hypothetical protein EZS28_038257 [Streblomastix strix]